MILDIDRRKKALPLFLIGILLWLAACDSEWPIQQQDPSASSILRISMKGIVTELPDPLDNEKAEQYVKTLRLIGFQDDRLVGNWMIEEDELKRYHLDDDPYIEIPLHDLENASFKRGILDLYAVANEEVETNNGLSTLGSINSKDNLSLLMIGGSVRNGLATGADPGLFSPFLMSASRSYPLLEQENEIEIELERLLAKVDLTKVYIPAEEASGGDKVLTALEQYTYKLSIKIDETEQSVYEYYPLFDGTATGTKQLTAMETENAPLYLSEAETVAVTVSVTLTGDDAKTYEETCVLSPISRNQYIGITGKIISSEDPAERCLLLQVGAESWNGNFVEIEYK
ncbi:hypothetical protein [Parabacteroides sp.]